jgi:hypothetical protein
LAREGAGNESEMTVRFHVDVPLVGGLNQRPRFHEKMSLGVSDVNDKPRVGEMNDLWIDL